MAPRRGNLTTSRLQADGSQSLLAMVPGVVSWPPASGPEPSDFANFAEHKQVVPPPSAAVGSRARVMVNSVVRPYSGELMRGATDYRIYHNLDLHTALFWRLGHSGTLRNTTGSSHRIQRWQTFCTVACLCGAET